MNYYLTQYYTTKIKPLFDLTSPIAMKYATNVGFTYVSDSKIRCNNERNIFWEKISFLMEFLKTIPEGSYVVFQDCDSLNVGGDLKLALHTGTELGMVQLRGGLGGKQLIEWYNAGLMIMLNTQNVRSFFDRVWERGGEFDENGINAELKSRNWTIGNNSPICGLEPEWNSWSNNRFVVGNAMIKSFHGLNPEDKFNQVSDFIKVNNLA